MRYNSGRLGHFEPLNQKVGDLTHADTNKHELDLSAIVPASCKNVLVTADRMGGGGGLYVYPEEGTKGVYVSISAIPLQVVCAIVSQRVQYSLTQANDDYDMYCFGYWTDP